MRKNDNRVYNRKTQRDLNIEMNLFVLFNGKFISVAGATFDDKPILGKVTDVRYYPDNRGNTCRLFIDNGAEYSINVRHGKPILKPGKITISQPAIIASFNNPEQKALEQFWKTLSKKSEPIEISFSDAVHAQDEISAKQQHAERELLEIELERIMRHSDRGAFEDGF